MGYFRKTASGVSWVAVFRVFTRGIAFLRTIVLARILSPAQFGVYGIAALAITFLEIVTETGINVVLIQKKGSINSRLGTAWTVSIIRGFLIAAILALAAAPVSSFFNSPAAKNAIYVISLVPFIRGFINPAIVQFQRNLNFSGEFRFRFSVFAFDSFVAIVLSLATGSAIGLVWGLVAGAVLELALSFIFIKPRPTFSFSSKYANEIINKGKWVTGAGIFQFLFRQGDDAVVGKLLGEGPLGHYQVAYKIATMPVSEVTDVVNRVVFPVYVKIREDKPRLRRAFARTSTLVSILALFLGATLFVFGETVVRVLLGSNWLEIIPLVKILSIFGVVQAVSNSATSLLLSLQKQHFVTFSTFISILVMAIFIIPMTQRYGLWGAAMAPLVGAICTMPVMAYFVWKSLYHEN